MTVVAEKLGILLMSKPESPDLETVLGLCRAASISGDEVEIFLMADSVYRLKERDLAELTGHGAKVSYCSLNTLERELDPESPDLAGCDEGSQFDLALIVESCDRFLAFT